MAATEIILICILNLQYFLEEITWTHLNDMIDWEPYTGVQWDLQIRAEWIIKHIALHSHTNAARRYYYVRSCWELIDFPSNRDSAVWSSYASYVIFLLALCELFSLNMCIKQWFHVLVSWWSGSCPFVFNDTCETRFHLN